VRAGESAGLTPSPTVQSPPMGAPGFYFLLPPRRPRTPIVPAGLHLSGRRCPCSLTDLPLSMFRGSPGWPAPSSTTPNPLHNLHHRPLLVPLPDSECDYSGLLLTPWSLLLLASWPHCTSPLIHLINLSEPDPPHPMFF